MAHVYLMENDIKAGYRDGQMVVEGTTPDGERCLPFATVDGISVFGMAQLSTKLVRQCIESDVAIGYYSADGHYCGRLASFGHVDPIRQKAQVLLTDNKEFCLTWSRKIVDAKIRNSLAFLENLREYYDFSKDDMHGLYHSLKNLSIAETVEQMVGFEGNAAKCYFSCLSKVLEFSEFAFQGRSARPPRDPFNSMLSYGYSLLYRNIIGAIERHGLHAHFAFMHKIGHGHAALASDLVEEYRALLVDRTVLDMIRAGEVMPTGFTEAESGAVYMAKDTMKRLSRRLSEVMVNAKFMPFLAYGDRHLYGFQVMLDKKIESVIAAIEHGDAALYKPFIWKPELDS